MGWLTFHETRSAKDYFIDTFKDEKNIELVDIAIVNFRTAYMAVKRLDLGYTYCLVYLLHRSPKSYYNFGYKDMSEFCGPGASECPLRILDKLTPLDEIQKLNGDTDIGYAERWRASCRENALNKKQKNEALKKGKVLKTKEPLLFTSGEHYQFFIKKNKKLYAIANYDTEFQREVLVRVRGWKHIEFEFV